MRPLRADEIAAFLGMSASGVRNVISRRKIKPIGKVGKAHVYDPDVVIKAAGPRDRRAA